MSFAATRSATIPQLNLNSYYGDLGLDAGDPQNVYVLDPSKLTELNTRNLDAGGIVLDAGTSYDLPEGKGSVCSTGSSATSPSTSATTRGRPRSRFRRTGPPGLGISLFVPRRRAWIKVVEAGATGPLALGPLVSGTPGNA